ncbi:MAG: hypothetical protein R2824_12465 [Saprospiraceae bacterium]
MKTQTANLVMGYWQYAALDHLHERSRNWLSEIAFWKEEILFMKHLITNHFTFFIDPKRISRTTTLTNQLHVIENDLQTLEENVREHEHHLKEVMQTNSDKLEKEYRKEHGSLENLLDNFVNDFKAGKRAVFKTAEEVLKEERMQRFIAEAG